MCLFGCDYGVSAITGLTVGAVSPQEIMPGPVSLVYTVSADHCHIVLGQGVTENNSKCLFFNFFRLCDGWGLSLQVSSDKSVSQRVKERLRRQKFCLVLK